MIQPRGGPAGLGAVLQAWTDASRGYTVAVFCPTLLVCDATLGNYRSLRAAEVGAQSIQKLGKHDTPPMARAGATLRAEPQRSFSRAAPRLHEYQRWLS